ncbi:MAG: hypothetical protein A2Y96_01715 [Firmicutes bacterium RBG_13_65_8]|nr:MAG: hypothetical protein A2Y96_01715 [Firmicutes bacterium RBG_13_65_8]
MQRWDATLWVRPTAVKLQVKSPEGDDLLKAQLPDYPGHPRALLTVLEGLALWCGKPLDVAILADIPVSHSLGLGAFTDIGELWPETSALVEFHFVGPARRGRRIRGHFPPLPAFIRDR